MRFHINIYKVCSVITKFNIFDPFKIIKSSLSKNICIPHVVG
jgi:hypothetical protein